jgi:hypothetical protein
MIRLQLNSMRINSAPVDTKIAAVHHADGGVRLSAIALEHAASADIHSKDPKKCEADGFALAQHAQKADADIHAKIQEICLEVRAVMVAMGGNVLRKKLSSVIFQTDSQIF